MQKLFNVMSAASFVMSAGMVIGTAVLYSKLPSIIEGYTGKMLESVTGNVTEMLPSQIDAAMPELPTSTGPAVPFKMP
jgi:hypothetical protein|tara:strand:- start:174 stop:407 length:234 start_codon:yes stop_codon:yes gene_type:complete